MQWHQMTPTPMPVASCVVNADGNGITRQKGHVAPLFNCLNLRNAVAPLMMLLASCDPDACAFGIRWQKRLVASHLDCHCVRSAVVPFLSQWPYVSPHSDHLELTNAILPLEMPSALLDANTRNMHHMTKKSC